MKIVIYTITDCQFSKQEKEYLTSHTLPFEEKNLETNREFLTEMLAVSNNFAGTPVTKIEKDDGQIVVLKGFTQDEFDKTLGFNVDVNQKPNNPQVEPVNTQQPPSSPQPVNTVPTTLQQPSPQPPEVQTQPPSAPPATPDPLAGVLNNLQAQANNVSAPPSDSPNLPPANL